MIYRETLAHYGTPGMHWGERKYQNKDGTLTEAGKKRYSKAGSLARLVGEAKRNQAAESYARNTSAPRATMTDISGSINAAYREASEARAKGAPRATITDDQRIQLAYKKASAARGSGSPRANVTVDQLIQLAYSKASEGTAKGSPRASAKNFDIFKEKLKHPISTGLNWIKHKFNTTPKGYPQHTVYL